MESRRLPRFKRVSTVAPIQLTDRDQAIIRLIHRHRFLRSSHIIALMGGNSQPLLRRLQLLYHHGFLERPCAQLEYFRYGGSHHMVYGLGNKGGAIVRQQTAALTRPLSWGEKNRAVKGMYLEHALLVSEIMVKIEVACRDAHIRFLTEEELWRDRGPGRQPFRWKVTVQNNIKLSVVPDRVFGLEFPGQDDVPRRVIFFLEADRGTMPVNRHNLAQTSFARKLLGYAATWSQGIHRSRFDFNRFRVLTVTKSTARVNSLIDACSQLKGGHGLFLFCDQKTFKQQIDVFAVPWQTGRGEVVNVLG